ncbi:beta-ketoacyl-[acyl-carrier-protein] synthase family protein [Variovorax boronicumulans]|uniref:beta-ketoacyl-[acyl-carrier-protein] synthase family protein n=1 Tax=Variovorax boronicumulans TaxID=436515 RepID=UPI00277FEC18|nr:beta-ketoacyl-[acyl-carrier-protein] synthase family protein [Variovorax boronicumulans]MDQ0043343.1 3-oxoacyl-[acyl-carrier-protein] synthase II [Variovorax boronicumulans]
MSSGAAHAVLAASAARAASAPVRVSGMGFVTPIGRTVEAFDDALFAGRSAVRAQTLEIKGMDPMSLAVAACDFDSNGVRSTSRLPLDRGTAMALAAAQDAATQAGLGPDSVDPERLGIFWGSGLAGAGAFDTTTSALYGEQKRMRPTTVLTVMPNAAVAELALHFGARGSAIAYACACASSAVAIGEAMRAIRGGWIDVAIVGGHDAMLTPGVMASWHAMRVMAPPPADAPSSACRPFSGDRAGFAIGEGAAALVIESEAHARARGAEAAPFVLAGYATNCDGTHITNPDSAGQVRAMRAALRDAGIEASDIGHINAHGTATSAGDAAEAASIREVFGNATPVSATKAIHGHVLGGGGAIELIAALRALARESLPPIANLQTSDAAFDLDFVRGDAREAKGIRYALSNSFAFGGTNAVIVAGRMSDATDR